MKTPCWRCTLLAILAAPPLLALVMFRKIVGKPGLQEALTDLGVDEKTFEDGLKKQVP